MSQFSICESTSPTGRGPRDAVRRLGCFMSPRADSHRFAKTLKVTRIERREPQCRRAAGTLGVADSCCCRWYAGAEAEGSLPNDCMACAAMVDAGSDYTSASTCSQLFPEEIRACSWRRSFLICWARSCRPSNHSNVLWAVMCACG